MKPVLWSAVFVIAASGLAAAGAGKIQWREGRQHDAAFAEAKATGVPVMVFFSSDCCGACQALSSDALSNDDVVKASEKLIRIHADAGQDSKLFTKYGVKQMPTMIFFSPEAEEVGRLTGRDATSVKQQFEDIAAKHTRGPRWCEDAAAAIEAGRSESKPVVLVFTDGKARSEQLLKSFGDAAYKDVFEKLAVAKVEFKKDSEDARKWGVTEAPTLVVIDARGESTAVVKAVKGLKSAKDLKREFDEILKKFATK